MPAAIPDFIEYVSLFLSPFFEIIEIHRRGTPFKAINQNIYENPFKDFLTPTPSTKVQAAINIAVETARKNAGLLNFILEEKEIRNNPRQTIKIPKKPYKFIVVVKNIILNIAINNDEPPLAMGYTKDKSPYL